MKTEIRLLGVLVLGLAGCATLPADPLAVIRAQDEAWNRGSIEEFMEGYHRSEDITFSSDQGTIRGWQAVLERYRKRYPDRSSMGKLSFSNLALRPLGRDAALVTGEWRLDRAGEAPAGLFSVVLLRLPEGWRIVHDHTSMFAR